MASKEEIIAKTNAAREARKLARDREAAAIKLQVTIWSFIKKRKINFAKFLLHFEQGQIKFFVVANKLMRSQLYSLEQ